MSRLHDLWRSLTETPAQATPEPKTRVVAGGSDNMFARLGLYNLNANTSAEDLDPTKRRAKVWKWRQIYQQGGPIGEAIDAYPLFVLSPGWQLVCEPGNEGLKDKVQEWLDQPHVDFDSVIWQGVLDAVLCGTAFQEIVTTRGGDLWGVVPRDSASFRINYDEFGRVTDYTQVTFEGVSMKQTRIPKDRIISVTLFPIPGEMYGVSLIGRAYDDIMRDCDVIESITKAIHRHGTPKQQWDVGTPENPVPTADLKEIKKEITDISSKTDFVTTNTRINMLDTGGVANVDTYSNVSLQRLAAALGVPEEMLGLGRGSTEATANVRIKSFYDKITTIQAIVARTYSREVIDRISGAPGMVWIQFNDPNAEDEAKKATWISQIMQASGMDPFAILPQAWIREQFGIDEEDYPEEEDDEPTPKVIDASQLKLPTQ